MNDDDDADDADDDDDDGDDDDGDDDDDTWFEKEIDHCFDEWSICTEVLGWLASTLTLRMQIGVLVKVL